VTILVRLACLFMALVSFFFAAFYMFADEWVTGFWAVISAVLLMFIREFIVVDDYYDDDDLT